MEPLQYFEFLDPKILEMEEVKPALTSPIVEEATEHSSMPSTPDIKHSDEGVVLIPRPSDDPRDPLVSQISQLMYVCKANSCKELADEQEGRHRCCTLLRRFRGLHCTSRWSTQCQIPSYPL